MNYSNKIKSYALMAAIAIASFYAPASQAQTFGQDLLTTATQLQVNSGQPYYRNGRAYYYGDEYVNYNSSRFNNERRFCPPGQSKKGHCRNWKYYNKYNRNERNDKHNNWNDNDRNYRNYKHD